jgi:hypothetical protein
VFPIEVMLIRRKTCFLVDLTSRECGYHPDWARRLVSLNALVDAEASQIQGRQKESLRRQKDHLASACGSDHRLQPFQIRRSVKYFIANGEARRTADAEGLRKRDILPRRALISEACISTLRRSTSSRPLSDSKDFGS